MDSISYYLLHASNKCFPISWTFFILYYCYCFTQQADVDPRRPWYDRWHCSGSLQHGGEDNVRTNQAAMPGHCPPLVLLLSPDHCKKKKKYLYIYIYIKISLTVTFIKKRYFAVVNINEDTVVIFICKLLVKLNTSEQKKKKGLLQMKNFWRSLTFQLWQLLALQAFLSETRSNPWRTVLDHRCQQHRGACHKHWAASCKKLLSWPHTFRPVPGLVDGPHSGSMRLKIKRDEFSYNSAYDPV